MFKYFFSYHTGYCGSDSTEVIAYDEQPTEEQLNADAWQGAVENAAAYGIYPVEGSPEDYGDDDDDEGSDEYSDNIEGTWEVYNADKHEGCY